MFLNVHEFDHVVISHAKLAQDGKTNQSYLLLFNVDR